MRKSKEGGRCTALNQYYKSKMVDEVFGTISEELIVKRNAGEVIRLC